MDKIIEINLCDEDLTNIVIIDGNTWIILEKSHLKKLISDKYKDI